MRLPVDTRQSSWDFPDGWARFEARGRKHFNGPRSFFTRNARRWDEEHEIWGARLFVGFKVGDHQAYHIGDLVSIVRNTREIQAGKPDASFVSQVGIYTHDSGEVVTEPGAQIIIIKPRKQGSHDFEMDMEDLAEIIASTMQQEEVIVELQRNGIVKKVFGVGPDE